MRFYWCLGRFGARSVSAGLLLGIAAIQGATLSSPVAPLRFERNVGQAPQEVFYQAYTRGGAVFVTAGEIVFCTPQGRTAMQLAGASKATEIAAAGRRVGVSRHFMRRDGRRFKLEAPEYEGIVYRNLYPGISLRLHGNPTDLEYDFVVMPGAKPSDIQFSFQGVHEMKLTDGGDLAVETPAGKLSHRRAVAFQLSHERRVFVEAAYELSGRDRVTFRLGPYDKRLPLVIDPAVIYSSAPLPGTIAGLAADGAGNLYVTGFAPSGRGVCGSIPQMFSRPTPIPCNGAIVTKFSPGGAQVIYRTMLAGTSEDRGRSIAVDAAGNAYVLGNTYSADFPVSTNAAQGTYAGPPPPYGSMPLPPGGDLFVAKLDASGNLLYATFLGGSGNERADRIRVDAAGNAYVSGQSSSSQFPTTTGAYLGSLPSGGGVVAKINPTGTQVLWSTYVNGNGSGAKIDLGAAGTVYAAEGPSVTKLNADGRSAVYAGTFGPATDSTADVAVDSQGSVWLVGASAAGDAFTRKVAPDGSRLMFATTIGQGTVSGFDAAAAVAVDTGDRVYVGGGAASIAVTPDAVLPSPTCIITATPAFLMTPPGFLNVFNNDGNVLYASYMSAGVTTLSLGAAAQVYTTDGSAITQFDLNAPAKPYAACAVNSASFALYLGQAAPGELLTLFGSKLGPQNGVGMQLDANGQIATTLAGTRVLFNGRPAPLLYASDRQINAVVPFGAAPGTTVQIEVQAQAGTSPSLALPITAVQPELFKLLNGSTGQAAVLNQDGTVNSPQNPASQGSIISLFGTGFGGFSPPLTDGQVAPVPAPDLIVPVQVQFDGRFGAVTFAGAAPGLIAGVVQINVRVPDDFPTGASLAAVSLSVQAGSNSTSQSQSLATVALR